MRLFDSAEDFGQSAAQVLKTPANSGQIAPSARFFYAHGVSNGRECDGYKTRKGKKSGRLFAAFELLPAPAQNGVLKSLKQEHTMSQSIIAIGETNVRQYDGLYSLNDLHKASGGDVSKRPGEFMRLSQTQELAAEIANAGIPAFTSKRGAHGGTYVCKELVYAYANWISPAFYLAMIRFFDTAHPPVGARHAAPLPPHNPHLLPPQQAEEIKARLNRLAALFHPFSDQYLDVLGILRCLRGNHPRLGMKEAGYRQVIEAHRP